MGLRSSRLLVGGALAVATVTAVVLVGRAARNETKTVGSIAAMPNDAAKQIAADNVRAAIPSLEAFYADHGTYGGADVSALRRDYDPGISPTVRLGWVEAGRYCLESTVEGQTASLTGPGGAIVFAGC